MIIFDAIVEYFDTYFELTQCVSRLLGSVLLFYRLCPLVSPGIQVGQLFRKIQKEQFEIDGTYQI